jgi:predicted lipoprotein
MPAFIKYLLLGLAILLLGWFSVNIKKLDAVSAARAAENFDATIYANRFWKEKLLPGLDKAVELDTLLSLLHTEKDSAFTTYSHALGIGNIRYFLVRGEGAVSAINADDISLILTGDSTRVGIETEYIFGNAVRDASGLIDINDFKNTMDFNNVSVALNTIIRKQVLPPFSAAVKKGSRLRFTGAIELNSEHLKTDHIKIMPVQLTLLP